ncbi:MAG TPA: preprotein translocase subunit SecA [Eubacteriales bacterium]|nr:preprotein translocase subunit SecA [Eubacteriales bacterium]
MGFLDTLLGNTSASRLKKLQPYVKRINEMEPQMQAMTDEQLRAQTQRFRERLANGETLDDIMVEAFATVREAAVRTVDMRHFDVQLLGGMVLHQGRIAEMKTGEGKTLVATLPAYLNALMGEGVHVVTVNDYLAKRDAQWMGKIYRFLGMSVGCIVNGMERDAKQEAYRSDITYGTNNEFGFDYLRDNMVVFREMMVQRELAYAIVDEVDSILIDEARTPLIISGEGEESSEMYIEANRFVRGLKRGSNLTQQSSTDRIMGEEEAEDGDYQCDIKKRTVQLTAEGIRKAEQHFGVENLGDPENMELNHHIVQALRAHALFERDKDYVVQDGQVLIVDEFTGRLMIGRRYSEGLHQALEAKEGVNVEKENQTLATITLQNYFRMYKKLSGMTGTAKTEESEFMSIYDLDVVEIPTNKPLQRTNLDDAIFPTEKGKFDSIVETIQEIHKTGQPVLVGTISVERSEYLSAKLTRAGIAHEVLNAKQHAKEAEIVAQAGKKGQVTIATNMAGRGTDILLGGNPDFLARRDMRQEGCEDWLIEEAVGHGDTSDPDILAARARYKELFEAHKAVTNKEHDEVEALGGLFILGTERHESRRIDNQLRGRSGRQGDRGATQFYVSFEDELMRRFGGERVTNTLNRFASGEQQQEIRLEMRMLTKQIEAAQKRVEAMNFETRKNVLRYDDVMNKQREIIYGQRRRVLLGEDLSESIRTMIRETIDSMVENVCNPHAPRESWDFTALSQEVCKLCYRQPKMLFTEEEQGKFGIAEIKNRLYEYTDKVYHETEQRLKDAGVDMRENERVILLRTVDEHWMEHIDAMDQLKQGIGLRSYAQSDPVYAYTSEGFEMFDAMVAEIREQTVRRLYQMQVTGGPLRRVQLAKPIEPKAEGSSATFSRGEKKVGRNDPCPCGSGKKYKNCCGKNG